MNAARSAFDAHALLASIAESGRLTTLRAGCADEAEKEWCAFPCCTVLQFNTVKFRFIFVSFDSISLTVSVGDRLAFELSRCAAERAALQSAHNHQGVFSDEAVLREESRLRALEAQVQQTVPVNESANQMASESGSGTVESEAQLLRDDTSGETSAVDSRTFQRLQ